jgi:CRISPR-associated protein Cas2
LKCLLVYDIPDDRIRTRVADICLDYGLDRIQYSSFLGDLEKTHQEELMMKLAKRLGKQPGNIQLFPICEADWRGRKVIILEAKADG